MNTQIIWLREYCKVLGLVMSSYTENFKDFKKGYKIIFATF